MGLELLLPYIMPIVASNVKGVAAWLGSKWGKGETFSPRKQFRTAVTGVVTMLLAWAIGMEPTETNLVTVAVQYGFVISFVDALAMKYVFTKLGLK